MSYKTYEVRVSDIGNKSWRLNGKLHREDGPAVERANGDKEWYLNDKLHRKGGPSIDRVNGTKYWHLNGKLHREDGPAIEMASGHKAWYLNGKNLSEVKFDRQINQQSCNGTEIIVDGRKYKLVEE